MASAPAKVILFGEHFVVYGKPAIALAINRRAQAVVKQRKDEQIYINSIDLGLSGSFYKGGFQAERGGEEARVRLEPIRRAIENVLKRADVSGRVGVNVEIRSSIPVAAGLGSSAAVAAATTMAVSHLLNIPLSKEDVFNITYEAECLVHGTPSGIDPAISTHGGVIMFQRQRGFTWLDVETEIPLVIGDTGIKRSTGELVGMVRTMRERYPSILEPVMEAGGKIVLQAVKALKAGDLPALGELMNMNHALLYAIGVSNEPLERLVHAARKAGALGAKLTGAGGGGCMIALPAPNRVEAVANAIRQAGGTPFIAKKTEEGVKVEG